jgi:hypothetical protein
MQHTWTSVTQDKTSAIFAHCVLFHIEVCGIGQRTSLAYCIAARLRDHIRLGRKNAI